MKMKLSIALAYAYAIFGPKVTALKGEEDKHKHDHDERGRGLKSKTHKLPQGQKVEAVEPATAKPASAFKDAGGAFPAFSVGYLSPSAMEKACREICAKFPGNYTKTDGIDIVFIPSGR